VVPFSLGNGASDRWWKMKLYTKTVEVFMVEIDGVKTHYYELMNLLEEVDSVDGYFNVVVVHGRELSRVLEAREVISTNIRGGSGPGKNIKKFIEELEILMKEWKEE
jgi:hypothetical protein